MFQPGSEQKVLFNKLGITDEREMELVETQAYFQMVSRSLETVTVDQAITVEMLLDLHRQWFGDIYPFAGKYRTENISKDGFMFCAAQYIPQEMNRYAEILKRRTPCHRFGESELAAALAHVHGEFILIHPFREGNGRLGRWVASLMALQAGYPILSFSEEGLDLKAKRIYFEAVGKFVSNEKVLIDWFSMILERTVDIQNP